MTHLLDLSTEINVEFWLNGDLVHCEKNLYTDDGMREGFGRWLANETVSLPDHIALSADNTPSANTSSLSLNTEFERKTITGYTYIVNHKQARLTALFTVTEGNGVIRQVGLFSGDSHRSTISEMDNTTDWSISPSGATLGTNTVTYVDGTGALEITVEDTVTSAVLSNSSLSSDLSTINMETSDTPLFQFWFRADDVGSLDDLTVQIGNSSSDYWEWTVDSDGFIDGIWRLVQLDAADSSNTGSPTFSSDIEHFELEINMSSGRTEDSNFFIDKLTAFAEDGVLWNVSPANLHKTTGDIMNVVWVIGLRQDA